VLQTWLEPVLCAPSSLVAVVGVHRDVPVPTHVQPHGTRIAVDCQNHTPARTVLWDPTRLPVWSWLQSLRSCDKEKGTTRTSKCAPSSRGPRVSNRETTLPQHLVWHEHTPHNVGRRQSQAGNQPVHLRPCTSATQSSSRSRQVHLPNRCVHKPGRKQNKETKTKQRKQAPS